MEHRPKNEVSSADGKALSLSTTRMPVGVRYFFDGVRGRELSALLALRHLGLASGGDVVSWSVDALAADLDTPSLRMLAGLSNKPNEFEVDGYLRDFGTEVARELPDRASLLDFYPRFIAERMVQGRLPPFDGAKTLYRFYLASGSFAAVSTWTALDDDAELATTGVYGTVPEVEQKILAAAAALLQRYRWSAPGGA